MYIWPHNIKIPDEWVMPDINYFCNLSKIKIMAFICGKCKECNKKYDGLIECKLNKNVIGNYDKNNSSCYFFIGDGLPYNCVYLLEYLIYTEYRKEKISKMNAFEKSFDSMKSCSDINYKLL